MVFNLIPVNKTDFGLLIKDFSSESIKMSISSHQRFSLRGKVNCKIRSFSSFFSGIWGIFKGNMNNFKAKVRNSKVISGF